MHTPKICPALLRVKEDHIGNPIYKGDTGTTTLAAKKKKESKYRSLETVSDDTKRRPNLKSIRHLQRRLPRVATGIGTDTQFHNLHIIQKSSDHQTEFSRT